MRPEVTVYDLESQMHVSKCGCVNFSYSLVVDKIQFALLCNV